MVFSANSGELTVLTTVYVEWAHRCLGCVTTPYSSMLYIGGFQFYRQLATANIQDWATNLLS